MLQEPLNTLGDNSMTPEEMSKSVAANKAEIEKLSQEVIELQKDCRHDEYDVKNVAIAPIDLRKVCRCCQLDLGYPSKEDLEKAGY